MPVDPIDALKIALDRQIQRRVEDYHAQRHVALPPQVNNPQNPMGASPIGFLPLQPAGQWGTTYDAASNRSCMLFTLDASLLSGCDILGAPRFILGFSILGGGDLLYGTPFALDVSNLGGPDYLVKGGQPFALDLSDFGGRDALAP